ALAGEEPWSFDQIGSADVPAVLRAAAETGVGRVVIVSSGSVYPLAKERAGRFEADRDQTAPASLYGLTKMMAEQAAIRLGQVYGLSTPILRLAGVYGPYERNTGVREILSAQAQVVAAAAKGQEARLARACHGGWLHSRDAADGLIALLDAPLSEPAPVFDLGGPEVFSVLSFCEAIAPAFPGWAYRLDASDPTIRFQLPADRPASDFERLAAATGFRPRFGLRNGTADYLAWLDRNR
ncbi:MAG: NAD-dependent epimerase/dehydratase family protein, partial [Verrucomicrobium sp.]